MLLRLVEFL